MTDLLVIGANDTGQCGGPCGKTSLAAILQISPFLGLGQGHLLLFSIPPSFNHAYILLITVKLIVTVIVIGSYQYVCNSKVVQIASDTPLTTVANEESQVINIFGSSTTL